MIEVRQRSRALWGNGDLALVVAGRLTISSPA
jgi:hypothetical protein